MLYKEDGRKVFNRIGPLIGHLFFPAAKPEDVRARIARVRSKMDDSFTIGILTISGFGQIIFSVD